MSCTEFSENTTTITPQTETISKDVNVEEFSKLIKKGNGQILDVRTPEEWATGIIKEAIKINFFDKDFQNQLGTLDKNQAVYIYCRSGGRSGKATKQMKKMGFTTVYNLIGGIGAWDVAGNKKVK
ncbi:MAG: rhodanese-like domain-containing protein [Flavobacteriales bacterium]|nr:rhodanese-like domain-containing protein [Flavobacteriales bacterium]